MDDFSIFAKRMKEAREREGIKQKTLAEDISVTPQTISAYEKAGVGGGGKGKNPTLENAVAIAKRLHVSLDWLCGIEANSSKRETIKTFGDAAKMIVELEDKLFISFELIREIRDVQTGSLEYPHFVEEQMEIPAIAFRNKVMENFIIEWGKIRNLRRENTIDEKLYRLWLEDRLCAMSGPGFEVDYPWEDFELGQQKSENECSDGPLPF